MKCILMDVEGTTTSISFVHDELFPYAYKRLESYLQQHQNEAAVIGLLQETTLTVRDEELQLSPVEALRSWIKADRKHPALKKLQGLIWQEGYERGEIKGHVYPDVAPAFKRWQTRGLTLAIYSSGSVLAQKQLFKHSVAGDLDQYIRHNFDTNVGHKREATSYQKIARELNLAASDILFLSDIPEELEAASTAGMQVKQLVRDERALSSRFEKITDFLSL